MYMVVQHYGKSKQTIPMLYIKVRPCIMVVQRYGKSKQTIPMLYIKVRPCIYGGATLR